MRLPVATGALPQGTSTGTGSRTSSSAASGRRRVCCSGVSRSKNLDPSQHPFWVGSKAGAASIRLPGVSSKTSSRSRTGSSSGRTWVGSPTTALRSHTGFAPRPTTASSEGTLRAVTWGASPPGCLAADVSIFDDEGRGISRQQVAHEARSLDVGFEKAAN